MCGDPISMAMMAMQVVQGVQKQNNAVEIANQQNALYLANAQNAKDAMMNDARSLNLRQDQEAKSKAQKVLENSLDGARKVATGTVAAGESGVSGNSVQRILDSYERTKSVNQGTIERNFDMVSDQLDAERQGLQYTFKNRVNSVSKGYAPSAFDAGLGIAASVGGTALVASSGLKENESLFGKDAFNRGSEKLFGVKNLWS